LDDAYKVENWNGGFKSKSFYPKKATRKHLITKVQPIAWVIAIIFDISNATDALRNHYGLCPNAKNS